MSRIGPRDTWEIKEGNNLIHELMGAKIKVVHPDKFKGALEAEMVTQKKAGRNPYFIPVGGSAPLGTAGYVNACSKLSTSHRILA